MKIVQKLKHFNLDKFPLNILSFKVMLWHYFLL